MTGARAALCAGLVIGTMAGCLLPAQQGGTPCATDNDCPVFFRCVDGDGSGALTCEAEQLEGGGELPTADAGETEQPLQHFYCTDVKPVLQRNCVNSCHGAETFGSGNPGFRFDIYADLGDQKGSYAMRDRVKARAVDLKTMPPIGTGDMTDAERLILAEWIAQGAPYCNDGSMPGDGTGADGGEEGGADGGSTADSGTTVTDAGTTPPMDAGVEVSFADDVQPIFRSRCGSCHLGGQAMGGANLDTAADSYASLVGQPSACNSAVPRVKAGDLQGSMLWRKLSDAPDKCGNVMPTSGALKSVQPAEFEIIETWIAQGAKNN